MEYKLKKIPQGWEVKKLGEIVELKNGFAFKSNLFCNVGIPIIRIKNIQDKVVILNDLVFCNPCDYKNNLDDYLIKQNDILIAMSGATTGKVGIYDSNEKAYLNQRVGLLRIDDDILRKYIFWFLCSKSEQNLKSAFGAAQPNLSTKQIHNIEIPLPPLKEQGRIAGILDLAFEKIDKSVELLKANLANLDELAQSVLDRAFNPLGDSADSTESTQNPSTHDTQSPYPLPQHWEWKTLGEIANTSSGSTPLRNRKEYWENGTIHWLKSGELNDSYINLVEEKITEEALKHSPVKLLDKGTLLIAMYGATAGKLGILNVQTTTNQAICAFLHKDSNNLKFFEKFLFYFLLSIRSKIISDSFGGAQPNISQAYIKSLQIPLPKDIKEQEQIAKHLDSTFERIKKLKELYNAQLQDYEELKQSLLTQAFSGKL